MKIPSPAAAKKFVGETDAKFREWSPADPQRPFAGIINLVWHPATLRAAYCKAAKAKGANAAGVDNMTCASVEQTVGAEGLVKRLHDDLRNRRYMPQAVREVSVDRRGAKRTVCVKTVRDRVVDQALRMVLSPIIEPRLHPGSAAYIVGRGPRYAVAQLESIVADPRTKLLTLFDIKTYYDAIDLGMQMNMLRRHVADERVLSLTELILRCGKSGVKGSTSVGLVQGSALSNLLANLYRHDLDLFLAEHALVTDLVGYGDDVVVGVVGGRENANTLLVDVIAFLEAHLKLELAPTKTEIVMPGDRFNYLGASSHWTEGGLVARPTARSIERLKMKLSGIAGQTNHEEVNTKKQTDANKISKIMDDFTAYFASLGSRDEAEQVAHDVLAEVEGDG